MDTNARLVYVLIDRAIDKHALSHNPKETSWVRGVFSTKELAQEQMAKYLGTVDGRKVFNVTITRHLIDDE